MEILAHRVFGCFVLTALLVTLKREWPALRASLATPRRATWMLGSALLIGFNWLVFIWAVHAEQVLATSLGYFLSPLINVALGVFLLGERLRPVQLGAIALAALGVGGQIWLIGTVPWVSLALALSFTLYGLLRKLAPVESLVGLASETALLVPVALVYLGARELGGLGAVANRAELHAATLPLLVGTGLATAAPLLWFAGAARRLPLSTLGLFQYIAPTLTFFLAVGLYDEAFTRVDAFTFGCIWLALAVYSLDALRS